MRRDVLRRIERLEQGSRAASPDKLWALAARLGVDEAGYRRAVQGHERELDPHLVAGRNYVGRFPAAGRFTTL